MKHTEISGFAGEQTGTAATAHAAAGPSSLQRQLCSNFTYRRTDEGSHAGKNVSLFVPDYDNPAVKDALKGYYFLGNFAMEGSEGDPAGSMMLYKPVNDDPNNPCLKPPAGFTCIWSKNNVWLHVWAITPPPGYVACGCIVTYGWDSPSPQTVLHYDKLMCVRQDLCEKVALTAANRVWDDNGSGAQDSVTIYIMPTSGTAWGARGYPNPSVNGYDITPPPVH